ncbi:MAG: hypothetical protein PHU46_03620 [Rhodocyclaceae bacterium]|nr:hypothetical protein [Rhodocyclaceae bacterium]
MIRVSLVYPLAPGKHLDLAGFCNRHLPRLRQRLGDACRSMVLERGLAGLCADWQDENLPDTPVTIVHLQFDSEDSARLALAPHLDEILAGLPECTNIHPMLRMVEMQA